MEKSTNRFLLGGETSPDIPLLPPNLGADVLSKLPAPEALRAGIIIQELGQIPNRVGLIRSGIVKLTVQDRRVEERMLGLRACDWWVNASILFAGGPSIYRVSTLTACRVSFLSISAFRVLLDLPLVLKVLLRQQSQHLVETQYMESRNLGPTTNLFSGLLH